MSELPDELRGPRVFGLLGRSGGDLSIADRDDLAGRIRAHLESSER